MRVKLLNPCDGYERGDKRDIDLCGRCGFSVLSHSQLSANERLRIEDGAMQCLTTHLNKKPEGEQCEYCETPANWRRDLHDYHCPHYLVFLLCYAAFFKVHFTREADYVWVDPAAQKAE